jgi:hypothetical protein
MEEFGEPAAYQFAQPPAPRQRRRRWLLFGCIALAFMFAPGMGALLETTIGVSQAQAAGLGSVKPRQTPTVVPGTPGTPGACSGTVTVTHVSGRVITVTRSDGSTATIYVGSRTHYTEAGRSVSLSAVKVGNKIYVIGSCTNGGRRIEASSIEITG